MKVNLLKVALTGGIIWGLLMLFTTIAEVYTGYGQDFLMVMQSIYPGYQLTLVGSLVGLVYGFLDVFVGVYVVVWVYRVVAGK